jgi:hypothetical protein
MKKAMPLTWFQFEPTIDGCMTDLRHDTPFEYSEESASDQ